MPWQDGNYHLFSQILIRNAAPAESGVFGLYNIQNRIFLGESDNIQTALLRLYHNMRRFGYIQPIGFTFEACARQHRRLRLNQLLADYDCKVDMPPVNTVLYG